MVVVNTQKGNADKEVDIKCSKKIKVIMQTKSHID